MLEKPKQAGSSCGPEISARTGRAKLKTVCLLAIAMLQPSAAATIQSDRSSADKARWVMICKPDIQRFCDEANLKQECLIAHWSKISAECQGVLGSSAGNRAGDGS